jgi:hypothetical protein
MLNLDSKDHDLILGGISLMLGSKPTKKFGV